MATQQLHWIKKQSSYSKLSKMEIRGLQKDEAISFLLCSLVLYMHRSVVFLADQKFQAMGCSEQLHNEKHDSHFHRRRDSSKMQ